MSNNADRFSKLRRVVHITHPRNTNTHTKIPAANGRHMSLRSNQRISVKRKKRRYHGAKRSKKDFSCY